MRLVLALASAGAGAIHVLLGPEHLTQWAPLGTGFYVSGALQVLWALWLVRRESRGALALGALGSLLFIGVWLVSRTTGLPVGPEAWQAERIARADVLCVALEVVVAAGSLVLLRRPAAGRVPARRATARLAVALAAVAALASTGVAAAAPQHAHGAGGGPCPSAPVASGVDKDHDGADDGVQDYFGCLLRHEHDDHPGYKKP
jgi:hypothetical protein